MSNARTNATPTAHCRDSPAAQNGGSSNRAISGWARKPVIKVVIEMPIWAPDS